MGRKELAPRGDTFVSERGEFMVVKKTSPVCGAIEKRLFRKLCRPANGAWCSGLFDTQSCGIKCLALG